MTNEQKFEIYQSAADILQGEGYEAHARDDYPARGMYGRETPAIVSDASGGTVAGAVMLAALDFDLDAREAYGLIPERQDSMGLSRIYY